jgi:hypothetical protein
LYRRNYSCGGEVLPKERKEYLYNKQNKEKSTFIINKILKMPELFRMFGMRFFFYMNDHLPIHVHVKNADGEARTLLIDKTFKFDLWK